MKVWHREIDMASVFTLILLGIHKVDVLNLVHKNTVLLLITWNSLEDRPSPDQSMDVYS